MTTQNAIYSQAAIDYHKNVLSIPFDGSEANRHAKKEAAEYIRGWIKHLFAFAQLSDTSASIFCTTRALELREVIIKASKTDGILW